MPARKEPSQKEAWRKQQLIQAQPNIVVTTPDSMRKTRGSERNAQSMVIEARWRPKLDSNQRPPD